MAQISNECQFFQAKGRLVMDAESEKYYKNFTCIKKRLCRPKT